MLQYTAVVSTLQLGFSYLTFYVSVLRYSPSLHVLCTHMKWLLGSVSRHANSELPSKQVDALAVIDSRSPSPENYKTIQTLSIAKRERMTVTNHKMF